MWAEGLWCSTYAAGTCDGSSIWTCPLTIQSIGPTSTQLPPLWTSTGMARWRSLWAHPWSACCAVLCQAELGCAVLCQAGLGCAALCCTVLCLPLLCCAFLLKCVGLQICHAVLWICRCKLQSWLNMYQSTHTYYDLQQAKTGFPNSDRLLFCTGGWSECFKCAPVHVESSGTEQAAAGPVPAGLHPEGVPGPTCCLSYQLTLSAKKLLPV